MAFDEADRAIEAAELPGKCLQLAHRYLTGEIPALAKWLEANVKKIREEHPNAVVTLSRTSNFDTGDGMWTYANVGFEINYGDEAL